ncbi:uncharacterized protein LOC123682034 [Harmonia axyridis]|uniref:uncharacterized protein LOC123682034 n=1 Tax=Harmonia axyridis TaxID=115357 RepID=UPI001E275A83|nr:uncharacterized protein LOC123682034 [Harmonia axyridis]
MSLIHQNVQSIGNTINKLEYGLQDHKECMILCLTEHWKSKEQLISLPVKDFNLIGSFCRTEGSHGGSAVYLHKSIEGKKREELQKFSQCGDIECAAVEFYGKNTSVIVLTIYRPPNGDMKTFFFKLENILDKIHQENKLIIIAGDFNIELLQMNKDRSEFMNLMESFNLYIYMNNLPITTTDFSHMETINKSFYLKPTTSTEIENLGKSIKNKFSSGEDEIPIIIIKLALPAVSEIMSVIINNSFKYGIFPESLKLASIKPLFKEGKPEDINNYRPISLLPGFSRIFEMLMSSRLMNFFVENELFTDAQHGYLQGRSTRTAIF